MSIWAYVPGTRARRLRFFRKGLYGLASEGEGIAWTEWQDGTVSPRPVEVDTEIGALRDVEQEERVYFMRGRAAEPKSVFGVDVWNVAAQGAGIVSTEAALIADREEHGEVYEGEPALTEAQRLKRAALAAREQSGDLPGEPADLDQEAVADGGHIAREQSEPVLYNLNPPRGYDGEAFSIALPLDYAPNPVDQTDVQQAITQAEAAGEDMSARLKWLLVGAGIVIAMWAAMTIIPWLLGQIGGSVDTSVNPALNIFGALQVIA